jgi:hypothetical protein
MVVAAGWWIAIVELFPKADRPYIGGSPTNSFLELTFGYNGLGRLNGNESGGFGAPGGGGGGLGGPPGGGGAAGGGIGSIFGGATGPGRLFAGVIGGQITWLVPVAIIAIAVGLFVRWKAPRTDPQRASVIVWGSWLLVTGAVFSAMQGIFHEYYTVALAPAIGALVGIGTSQLCATTALGRRIAVMVGSPGGELLDAPGLEQLAHPARHDRGSHRPARASPARSIGGRLVRLRRHRGGGRWPCRRPPGSDRHHSRVGTDRDGGPAVRAVQGPAAVLERVLGRGTPGDGSGEPVLPSSPVARCPPFRAA